MKERFDIIGSLPDTIMDEWIENESLIGKMMDEYIEAQKRVNGFDCLATHLGFPCPNIGINMARAVCLKRFSGCIWFEWIIGKIPSII